MKDFFTHEQWIKNIKEKIQRKINTIKVPNFIDELTILDIDLGMVIFIKIVYYILH